MTYEEKATRLITIINTLANNDTVAKGAYTMFDPFELSSEPDATPQFPYVDNNSVVFTDLEWTFGVINDKLDESTDYTSLTKEGLALLEDILNSRGKANLNDRNDRACRLGLAVSGVRRMLYAGWLRHIAFVHEGIYVWDTQDFEAMFDCISRIDYVEMELDICKAKCHVLEGGENERTRVVMKHLDRLFATSTSWTYSRYLLSANLLLVGPLPAFVSARVVLGETAKNEVAYLTNLKSEKKYKTLQRALSTR